MRPTRVHSASHAGDVCINAGEALAPRLGLGQVCLSHPVCFPFLFSLQHPLFSSLFSRGNHQIFRALSRDPSLRLVWGRPKISQICEIPGILRVYLENPGIPEKYPATAWVSCRFPQFCLRFCPRPALRLRETREFPEWSTKHPLFSLEISGNAKNKVLGTLCFPFCLPENLVQANERAQAVGRRPQVGP